MERLRQVFLWLRQVSERLQQLFLRLRQVSEQDPHPLAPSPTRTHARPGEGGTRGSTGDQGVADPVQYLLRTVEKLLVLDAEHSQAQGEKESVPALIVELLGPIRVNPAVQLDDQLPFMTVEIGHIASDRNLPSELGTQQLAIPQQLPERRFRFGLCFPQPPTPRSLLLRRTSRRKAIQRSRKRHAEIVSRLERGSLRPGVVGFPLSRAGVSAGGRGGQGVRVPLS